MATLSQKELTEMTNKLAKRIKQENDINNLPIQYSVQIISNVFQAIEDWLSANKSSAASAIDSASDPVVLPGKIKKWAFALVVFNRCKEDLI